MRVSALIVTHDTPDDAVTCVQSLWAGSKRPEEFIVINNGNAQKALEEFCENHPADIRYQHTANAGFGAGVNTAAGMASGDCFLVSNPDMTYSKGCLETLAAYLADNRRTGIVAPRVVSLDGELQATARSFPKVKTFFFHRTSLLSKLFPGNRMTREYLQGTSQDGKPEKADWVMACSMLIRREAFESIDGFDQRYFLFMEDVDICKRLSESQQWDVVYHPGAHAVHALGISDSLHPEIIRHRHASIRSYIHAHFGHYPWVVRKISLAAATARERLLLMRASRKKR